MSDQATIAVLNHLHVLHKRTLACYLNYAEPWTQTNEHAKIETLNLIANAQETMSDRLGEAVLERHGELYSGDFPLVYADWHDLSLDFLISKVIANQQQLIAGVSAGVKQLSGDVLAAALASEALGEAKGHLESLEELVRPAPTAG